MLGGWVFFVFADFGFFLTKMRSAESNYMCFELITIFSHLYQWSHCHHYCFYEILYSHIMKIHILKRYLQSIEVRKPNTVSPAQVPSKMFMADVNCFQIPGFIPKEVQDVYSLQRKQKLPWWQYEPMPSFLKTHIPGPFQMHPSMYSFYSLFDRQDVKRNAGTKFCL